MKAILDNLINWMVSMKKTAAGKPVDPEGLIVLVYTLGKVASSTVYRTISDYDKTKMDVHHVHFLSDNWLEKILPAGHPSMRHNIAEGKFILDHIARHPEKRVKIITLTREPIARDVSDILQNWKPRFGGKDVNEVDADEILGNFKSNNDFSYTTTWFDTELFEYTGFDIYSVPFDTKKGYSIYKTEKFDILVIQSEKLSGCFQAAFHEFLGVELDKLSVTNESDKKVGGEKIQELRKQLKYTRKELDRIYKLKYMTHFYSKAEIAGFYEKWMG